MRADTKAVELRKAAVEFGPMTYQGFRRMVNDLGARHAYELMQKENVDTDRLMDNFREDEFEGMHPADIYNRPEDRETVQDFIDANYA